MSTGSRELGTALIALRAAGKSQTVEEQAATRGIPKFLVRDALDRLVESGWVRRIEEDGIPCYVPAAAKTPGAAPKPAAKPRAKARGTSRLT